jgi:hypothetical protein
MYLRGRPRSESGPSRPRDGHLIWDSAAWVPSFNGLIPLIFLSSKGERIAGRKSELARRWILLTTTRSYFSGAVHTLLDRILRKLAQRPRLDILWNMTRKRLAKLRPDDFGTGRISGPVMGLYASMIREAGARDWQKPVRLDGTVLGHNASLQVHHFFPRALLRREKYDSGQIDTLANYMILSRGTNLHLSVEEPATYLRREKVDLRQLDKQCIPLDRDLWRVGRYPDFLEARKKLLAARGNEFLGL